MRSLVFILTVVPAFAAAPRDAKEADAAKPVPFQSATNPPEAPRPKSPVENFRELLAATPAQRAQQLAAKPQREFLLAKLREYDRLSPAERERRLQQMQLRYYLRPLMESPPAVRKRFMAFVPAEMQQQVTARLEQWDLLPEDLRKEVLENAWMTQYVLRFSELSPNPPSPQPEPERQALAVRFQRWQAIPQQHRLEMSKQFESFFEMTPVEKQKTLDLIPSSDRAAIETNLVKFEKLPAEQRRASLQSWEKFSGMSAPDRDAFLQNARRWADMSEHERDTWRKLVKQIPPLPPGYHPQFPKPPGQLLSTGQTPPPGLSGSSVQINPTPSLPGEKAVRQPPAPPGLPTNAMPKGGVKEP